MPYGTAFKPQEPGVNWTPFVLVFIGLMIALVVTMQGGWIGQVMRGENKMPDDPIAKMSTMDARAVLESELNKNLTAVGATKSTMTWKPTAGTADADGRALDGPVELTINTKLPDKELRKQVVDPIKPYMEKAKVFSLVMNDSASHANWTYNVQPATSSPDSETGAQ